MVDLELLSWNTVEEVTDDKKIIKKVTKKGEGYEKPNPGSTVTGSVARMLPFYCAIFTEKK